MASIYGVSLKDLVFNIAKNAPESATVCLNGTELGRWAKKSFRSEYCFDETVLRPAAKRLFEYRGSSRSYRFRPVDVAMPLIDQLLTTLAYLDWDEDMYKNWRDDAGYPVLAVFEEHNPTNNSRMVSYMGIVEVGDGPVDGTIEGYVEEVVSNGRVSETGPYTPLAIYLSEDDFTIK